MTAAPELTGVHFNTADGPTPGLGKPLLVLGPSLGTSTPTLWGACAGLLTERYHVIGWDLPGHGGSPAARQFFDIPALAASVLALVDGVLADRGERGGTFVYAGVSVGGAVGLQLLLDHPGRISAAATICSGARIGTPQSWLERAETVRANGTPSMVTGSAARWFSAGFVERRLAVASALLQALQDTERFSYAWVCEALARFDVRDRLAEIGVPLLAVAGSEDVVTPPEFAAEIAAGVIDGRLEVVDGVAHLAPAENPGEIAVLLDELMKRTLGQRFPDSFGDISGPGTGSVPVFQGADPDFGRSGPDFDRPHLDPDDARTELEGLGVAKTVDEVLADGMRVRREVLGDAHVDRAIVSATDFTADFQELITSYAWGSIWTRPGLDRRSRSMITLTALVALGHHEELALHVRAARTIGLTDDEIKEVLLQSAIYCGVPAANTAFRIAQQVLTRMDTGD
jgi:3-oxoadipate enol-lactonase/4-carboxymuconolactone decarboxylase